MLVIQSNNKPLIAFEHVPRKICNCVLRIITRKMCVGFLYGEVTHPGIHFPRFNCDWQQVLPLLVFCFILSCDNGRQMFFIFIHVLRCWIFINSTNNYVFVSSTGGETASKLMELLKQIQHVGRRDRMLIRTLCMNWDLMYARSK